ncbi:hypothetical protein SAMN04487939_101198 [Lysobacter sp. yr284]|uniref:hypothetical protein n=1 Tax=Lysobacter sp. yr284 TaxID=1761791 RepID=UPI0008949008|nr:hypothetical protein [Lysobacter sp. yr284]SDY19920.1 hypothetical protein SAMN04487939_101198 [Lysobacter sp. yr284]
MNTHRTFPLIVATVLSLGLSACDRQPAGAPASPMAQADGAAGSEPAAPAASTPAPPAPTATAPASTAPMSTEIPQGFSSYASESIGDNKQCVAGTATDEDGMNQRPVAYLAQASGKPIWTRVLDLPSDTYQSRATHCLRQGDALYVLLQSDTQPEQSLSQTLLRVVKLNLADGAVQAGADVVVPGAKGAYSARVDEGGKHLRWDNGNLVVSGQYFQLDAPDQRSDFTATLKPDLSR